MAGFKCDICGGDIKMQANKTGVCQSCGMEYDIEAIRAMAGQLSAPAPQPQSTVAAAQTQDEIDRESLLVYLSDVRLLETMLKQSGDKHSDFSEKVAQKKNSFKLTMPEKPLAPSESDHDRKIEHLKNKYKGEKESERAVSEAILISGISGIVAGAICFPVELTLFGAFLLITSIPVLLAGIIKLTSETKADKKTNAEISKEQKNYEAKKQNYEQDIQLYNEQMEDYNKNYPIKQKQKQEFEAEAAKYEEDMTNENYQLVETLKKAYNANIIPKQFRNIEGVYYLYDYLSTSNQSLSEALMQANLEAIKQKLDNMIKLQSVQIIQQAQTNAKLDSIQAQNARLIKLSEATMNNTAVAAKYAQIAAVNSELNVKLAAESLAYQKAEFWLK